MELLKVGDLAERSGLTVRTLHHYEELGLLAPAQRTPSGHRLYAHESVARLRKITALKQLGMSLEEIRGWLENRASVLPAVRAQRARVGSQMEQLRAIARRLEVIENHMDGAGPISVDDVLEALEAMQMFEKYYTQEQLDYLAQRREQLGDAHIKEVEQEWPQLIAKVRAAMQRGVDPHSDEMRALGKRWKELIEEFTGGDAGIYKSLGNLYANEPSVAQRSNLDGDLMAYVQKSWS